MSDRILIVDDERRMAEVLALVLRRAGFQARTAGSGEAALAVLGKHPVDLVVTDLKMPGMDGVELLRQIRAEHGAVPVLLMTAFASVSTAVEALRLGAFDYITKPFDNADLVATCRRALETAELRRQNAALKAELGHSRGPDSVIAESDGMRGVLDVVRRVAGSTSTVLITGETGTGKEVVARALHVGSDRVGKPFVAVNSRALAEGVLESELFGHEKGAFTGAHKARPGVFERADGGTLFLDEIGDVDERFQAKLLRVLQEREVQRVGGDVVRKVDVRLICATHQDLPAAVEAGRFRQDLYFRLAVLPIHLPPLRERPEDVLPLARRFAGRHGVALSEAALDWLVAQRWPGNVRELENAVERGSVLCRDGVIEPEDLVGLAAPTAAGAATLREALDRATVEAVRAALARAGGKADAARLLGVDRTTLHRLIKRHGIDGGGSVGE